MLTIDALRAALKRVTYRPGWRMVLYQSQHEGVWMSVKAELDDPNSPGKTTMLNVRTAVPPIPHEQYFFQWLAYRIGRIESHEAREMLRIDGQKFDDPHAPDANE